MQKSRTSDYDGSSSNEKKVNAKAEEDEVNLSHAFSPFGLLFFFFLRSSDNRFISDVVLEANH